MWVVNHISSNFYFVEISANSKKRTLEFDCEIQWKPHFMFFMLRFHAQFQSSKFIRSALNVLHLRFSSVLCSNSPLPKETLNEGGSVLKWGVNFQPPHPHPMSVVLAYL